MRSMLILKGAVAIIALFTFSGCRNTENDGDRFSYAAVADKMYRSARPGEAEVLAKINGAFSFNCHDAGTGLIVYARLRNGARERQGIWRMNKRSGALRLLIDDTLSWFTAGNASVVTVAKNPTPGKGFEVVTYPLKAGMTGKSGRRSVGFVDISVNDGELIDDTLLFLSGSASGHAGRIVYRLNLGTGAITAVLKVPGSDSFVKLVACGRMLYMYQSTVSPAAAHGNLTLRSFDAHDGDCRNPAETVLSADTVRAFFGKGFSADGELFLPMINRSGDAAVAVIRPAPPARISAIIPLPTSIYRVAAGTAGHSPVMFVGYNYFRDQSAFHLVWFDVAKRAVAGSSVVTQ